MSALWLSPAGEGEDARGKTAGEKDRCDVGEDEDGGAHTTDACFCEGGGRP